MIKKFIIIIIMFFVLFNCKTQSIYNINDTLSNFEILKLSNFCKIWGLMKYYHPKISKGKYNWDKELIRELPKIKICKNFECFNNEMIRWMNKYPIKNKIKNNYCNISQSIDFDKNIINDSLFCLIDNIYLYANDAHFYYEKNFSFPSFKNEKPYFNMADSVTIEYRLLTLFRFWNVINYFFPYKHLITEKWENILVKYIPILLNSKDNGEYYMNIYQLVFSIEDAHAKFDRTYNFQYSKKFKNYVFPDYYHPPFIAKRIENKLVITELLNDTINNFQVGDEIISEDNKTIEEYIIEKKQKPDFAYSNINFFLDRTFPIFLNSDNKISKISFKRDNKLFYDTLIRISIKDRVKTKKKDAFKIIDSNLIYFNVCLNEDKYFWDYLINNDYSNKNFVIDFRGYSNYIFDSIVKYFYNKDTVFCYFKKLLSPGCFDIDTNNYTKINNSSKYDGKIVLLVNSLTLSQSEYCVMAFQGSGKAVVVGTQTAGTDGNVTSFIIPGGGIIKFSGLGVYYPKYIETQKIGVKIDFEVSPTIEGIRNGKDEQLEKAIEIIKNKK